MKISYLVTCSTESETLKNLLWTLNNAISSVPTDEVVILIDTLHDKIGAPSYETVGTFICHPNCILEKTNFKSIVHPLNNDYGAHKNYGVENCSGDFIFQIDGDELPPETLLGENLKLLIGSNPGAELFWIPRVNDFKGVTEEHAKQWGWNLSMSPTLQRPLVNWNTGDYQGRIFKNDYPRIKWKKKLHEQIDGFIQYVVLPKKKNMPCIMIKPSNYKLLLI